MEVGDGVAETWSEIRKLSRTQILKGAERTAENERDALVEFLLHLAVIEQRGDYERAGQRSLWRYLVNTLRFPKCQTSLRYHSARLLVKFPEIANYLADGRLSMTTLVPLKDILDSENLFRLLDAASNKTKDEVLVLVASFNAPILPVGEFSPAPPADVVELSREVVVLREDGGVAPHGVAATVPEADGTVVTPPVTAGQAVLVMGAPAIQKIKPIAPDQLLFTATVSNAFKDDLEELADALSHVFPEKRFADLLHYCVKQALGRVGKRRGSVPVRGAEAKKTADPDSSHETAEKSTSPGMEEPSRPSLGGTKGEPADVNVGQPAGGGVSSAGDRDKKGTRVHITAELERAVWERDCSCRWQLANGQLCESKYQCQLDHIFPVALGGLSVLSNLRLLCRQHNLQAEREAFGDACVDQFTKESRAGP